MKWIYNWQDKTYIRKLSFYKNNIFHYMWNRDDNSRREFIISRFKNIKQIKRAIKKDMVWRKELKKQYEISCCEYKASLQIYQTI